MQRSGQTFAGEAPKASPVEPGGLPLPIPKVGYIDFEKRCFDFVLSLFALVALFPVLAVVSLLVAMERRGPVLFRQQRLGHHRHVFTIYKFRTLHDGPEGKRATALGRFLRRASLDELPQLFNVLRGEMSLVGPRPHAIGQGERPLDHLVNANQERFAVRPGLTGLAQISGHRGAMNDLKDVQQRLAHDIAYVRQASLRADIGIIWSTLWQEVVTGRGS
ncbi:hypothetical protein GCM10007989_36460 [Devosia pacifica]|uniref:Bacterial sugar transferase domain-containing protein n=1 Tax=Devosia pacifica TaxID=1335967 RepID=A0A918VWX0_9HYPH|nr:sugar transferase [Devosia pacifica]GHA37017.1 hypothetical protein GCM10007989_36460 [Devosia pacifica]